MISNLLFALPGPVDDVLILTLVTVGLPILGSIIALIVKAIYNLIDKNTGGSKKQKGQYKPRYDIEGHDVLKGVNGGLDTVSRVYDLKSKQTQFQRNAENDELRRQERQHNLDKKILQDDLYLSQKQDDFEWKKQKRIWEQEDRERRKQSGGSKKWHKK